MQPSYLAAFATTLLDSFQTVWLAVVQILPSILAALVVMIIGWFGAMGLGHFVQRAIELTQIDDVIDKAGLDRSLSEVGIDFNLAKLIGWLVKWFVIVVALILVADILQFTPIIDFLKSVADFIPKIIIALVMLLVGFVLGNFAHNVVEKSIQASKLAATSGVIAALAKWAIVVFAVLAALTELNIAKELIQTLFTGLVGMLALAGGLAFGLGGKDEAKDILQKVRRELER